MAQIQLLPLDILPDYIPFLVQCQDGSGAKTSPSVDNLIIYEEGGADATPDTATITGSPFDPVQINSKTGLWGVWIPKMALAAGKIYIALWEMTIDGTAAAKLEIYLACTASDFKASGFSTFDPAADTVTTDAASRAASQADVSGLATSAALAVVDGIVDAIKLKTDNLPADPAGVSDLPDVSGLSTFDPAADSVDVGKVAGTAVTGVADFRATGFSTHTPADIRTELSPELARIDADISSRLAGTSYTAPPDANSIATAVWSATTRTLTGFGALVSDIATAVWGAATRTLTAFGFAVETDGPSREASKADVSGLATTARIDSLEAHGDSAWATGSTAIDVSAIADAVWDEPLADHVGGGSAGEKLGNQVNPPSQTIEDYQADVSNIPAAVRSELSTELGRLDATVSSRLASSAYTAPPDVSNIQATTDRLSAMIGDAGGYDRWLATALEMAPTGGSAPTVEAIRAEMDANSAKLANLDAAVSSRAAAGAAMTLTAAERTNLAAALEAAIVDELDGTAVMQAIANLIASDMTTGDLSVQAIAAAVRDTILDRVLAGNHDAAGTPGAFLQRLDEAVSSRLAAADYSDPPDITAIQATTDRLSSMVEDAGGYDRWLASALEESPSDGDTSGLATSSEIAALASHGDAHWATADVSGLSTFQPGTDTVNVDLSGLADKDTLDSVAAVAAKIDGMTEFTGSYNRWSSQALEQSPSGTATVDVNTIHDALDTWEYQGEEASPPVVLPPSDASLCSLYAWFGKHGVLDPEKMTAKIVQLPYKAFGRYWPGLEETFTLDPEQPGVAYCHMPVGAEVLVVFKECGLRSRFEVPDAATYEI